MASLITNNNGSVVLLPFATPHLGVFKSCKVFHPAAHPSKPADSTEGLNETKDYSGYSSVKIASMISHTVIATIPSKSTVAGLVLDSLLGSFINTDNILAEVERIEVTDCSIASQVKVAFEAQTHAKSVVVVWPYQVFNRNQAFSGNGVADFAYTHPMANIKRGSLAECVVVAQEGDGLASENEIVCKDVLAYEAVDDLIKGHYTRVVSIVALRRDDFEAFVHSPEYPDLSKLLKKTLVGKRGVLVNPQESDFI